MKTQKPEPKPEAMTAPATLEEIRAKIALTGNLAGLTISERWEYYQSYCEYLGLDPLTRPFDLLLTYERGANDERVEKLTLYANASCSTQIADKREVTYSRPQIEPLPLPATFAIWVEARLPNGRTVWNCGIVDAVANKGGRNYENAVKRATTQAHRRATLALCGIAMPDESEIPDIDGAKTLTITPPPAVVEAPSAKEIFDTPRPLPATPLPVAWTADTPAREIADQQIANEIRSGLNKIADEVKAETPPEPPSKGEIRQAIEENLNKAVEPSAPAPDPMPARIAEAREKNMPTGPQAKPPVKAPAPPPAPNRGPVKRNHSPEVGARLDRACADLTARGVTGNEMLKEVNVYLDGARRPRVPTRYSLDETSAIEVCEVFERWIEITDQKAREARGSA